MKSFPNQGAGRGKTFGLKTRRPTIRVDLPLQIISANVKLFGGLNYRGNWLGIGGLKIGYLL